MLRLGALALVLGAAAAAHGARLDNAEASRHLRRTLNDSELATAAPAPFDPSPPSSAPSVVNAEASQCVLAPRRPTPRRICARALSRRSHAPKQPRSILVHPHGSARGGIAEPLAERQRRQAQRRRASSSRRRAGCGWRSRGAHSLQRLVRHDAHRALPRQAGRVPCAELGRFRRHGRAARDNRGRAARGNRGRAGRHVSAAGVARPSRAHCRVTEHCKARSCCTHSLYFFLRRRAGVPAAAAAAVRTTIRVCTAAA